MAACFALNAVSFLVVIWALMSLHVKHIPTSGSQRMLDELRIGLSYVRDQGSLVALIVLAAATTFLGFAVLTFLPLFARSVFHEGASTYSHLLAFSGAGSVVGALVIAWLGKFKRMGLTALLVQAVYGLLILGFAMSRVLWLSELLLFLTGAALMMVFSTVTSLIQLIAPNEMRGRVMSIYMVAFRGGMPLGSLVSGYLATSLGAPVGHRRQRPSPRRRRRVFPGLQPRRPGRVGRSEFNAFEGGPASRSLSGNRPTWSLVSHFNRRKWDRCAVVAGKNVGKPMSFRSTPDRPERNSPREPGPDRSVARTAGGGLHRLGSDKSGHDRSGVKNLVLARGRPQTHPAS